MATMFEQKGTPYRRSFGSSLLIAFVILFFLVGFFLIGKAVHTRLRWQECQLQFAASIYDAGTEGGYLQADDTHEAVQVCTDNAVLVLRMMQTGKAVKQGVIRDPQRQIWLKFSNGTHGILSEYGQDQTHIAFTGLNGETYTFWLGKCKFSNMITLLSVEGANYPNEAWVD